MGQIITNYQDVAIAPAVGFTVAETKEAYKVDTGETFTKYPNSIFDTLSSEGLPLTAYLSLAEKAILSRCVREANGWHKTKFRMSLSEMAKLEGLSKQGVINCARSLAKSGLIFYDGNNGVGLWTLNLSNIESTLEYYVSQYRSTELTTNKPKHGSTEFTEPSTEFTDKAQSGKVSLPPSNKEKIQINSKEITTKESASKSDAPRNELVIDSKISSYITFMGWQANDGTTAKAKAAVMKLCSPYGDTLTDETFSLVLSHLRSLGVKRELRAITAKFTDAVIDVEKMASPRIKSLVEAIKAIYGHINDIDDALKFEYAKLAMRMPTGITPEKILAFPAIWESNCNGYALPGYNNIKLIGYIQDMKVKGEMNNVKEITGNDSGRRGAIDSSIFAGFERAKMAMPVL